MKLYIQNGTVQLIQLIPIQTQSFLILLVYKYELSQRDLSHQLQVTITTTNECTQINQINFYFLLLSSTFLFFYAGALIEQPIEFAKGRMTPASSSSFVTYICLSFVCLFLVLFFVSCSSDWSRLVHSENLHRISNAMYDVQSTTTNIRIYHEFFCFFVFFFSFTKTL